jgi:ATP-dependent DNA helicase RecQ
MRDQVLAAQGAGLRAATINSTNHDQWDEVVSAVQDGTTDILFISPERLANPSFAARCGPIIAAAGLVVIDEAHCISDWGFDFRPDYQRLSRLVAAQPDTPVLATTATANNRVTTDVATQLGTNALVLRGSLARPSLHLSVVPGLSPLERYAWVARALGTLPGSGIIYVPTVAQTDRLAGFLASKGHKVAAYSGALDAPTREAIEDALKANELKAVVATSALGMGYDKPDLGFCIHVGSPSSPVAYYQQVGRAGRAIDRAEVVLLPAETDEKLWEYFATSSIPSRENSELLLSALRASDSPLSVPSLEAQTGLRRGRIEAVLKVLAVDDVVCREEAGWRATEKEYRYDVEKWQGVRRARSREADLMRRYASGAGCLMEFLQTALDDPSTGTCKRCSVCTPPPHVLGIELTPSDLANASLYLRDHVIPVEPRKIWPSKLASGNSGRIVGAEVGRALAFADDPAWKDILEEMYATDQEPSSALVAAITDVLKKWKTSWPARPVALCTMPTSSFPTLTRALAEKLGQLGNIPVLDLLAQEVQTSDATSGRVRVDALQRALHLTTNAKVPRAPVVLLCPTYRDGWPETVAAALLRQAGATAVLPLIVHQLP